MISFALAVLLASVLAGETPPRRAHHALAFDESRGLVILTAGSTPLDGGQRFQLFNDMWGFDGRAWVKLAETGEKLSGIGLAYDAKRRRLLSFGGFDGRSRDILRAFDGESWTKLGRLPAMTAAEPGFVHDVARDRFVAFGGSPGPRRANGDTWEFDGSEWTKIDVVTSPEARQAHAMTFDSKRNRTVVFGGMIAESAPGSPRPAANDTWEYDGKTWTKIDAPGPPGRAGAGVAFDSKRGRVILFGGDAEKGVLGDTWAYDGKSWTKLSDTGPEPRVMGYLAYDPKRDRVVLFGGRKGWPDDLDDTWEFDGQAWKKFEPK